MFCASSWTSSININNKIPNNIPPCCGRATHVEQLFPVKRKQNYSSSRINATGKVVEVIFDSNQGWEGNLAPERLIE